MSDVAIVCLTVVPCIYVFGLIVLLKLELRAPREPRRRRERTAAPVDPLLYEPPPYRVPPGVTPPSLAAEPRKAAVESPKPHPHPVTPPRARHEITRGD
jgi:hypothetical protein